MEAVKLKTTARENYQHNIEVETAALEVQRKTNKAEATRLEVECHAVMRCSRIVRKSRSWRVFSLAVFFAFSHVRWSISSRSFTCTLNF